MAASFQKIVGQVLVTKKNVLLDLRTARTQEITMAFPMILGSMSIGVPP
jgi:hypothetical protein